jgi:hypothetical protein
MASSFDASAITGKRDTLVTLDYSEDVVVEPAILLRRRGNKIFPESSSGVQRLASGIFILSPLNDLAIVHESSKAHAFIVRLSNWHASSVVVEVPMQRLLSELTGIGASSDVAATGDWFCTKRIAAGATWNNTIAGDGGPLIANPNYPMDLLATAPASGLFPENQGFLLKFIIPGVGLLAADNLLNFRFGGPISAGGYGEYTLSVNGRGEFILYEKIAGAWSEVNRWQAVDGKDMGGTGLIIRIIPHWPRFIELRTFSGYAASMSTQELSEGNFFASIVEQGGHSKLDPFIHEVKNRGDAAFGPNGLLTAITGQGTCSISVRRDIRAYWQVSRLAYPSVNDTPAATGTLTDRPFVLPYGVSNAHITRLHLLLYNTVLEDGTKFTDLTGELQTSAGGALTPGSEVYQLGDATINASGWFAPGGLNKLRAVLTFKNLEASGASWHTPMLEGYEIIRNAHIQTVSPGEKTARAQEVSISGPGYEADQETAHVVIEDPTNGLQTLRTRKTPLRLTTTFDDSGERVVLFEGYTARVTASLKGKADRVYPSPNWHMLECDLVGKWDRLSGKFFHMQPNFGDDRAYGIGHTGPSVAWRVTDILKWCLGLEFPASQINIATQELRLFVPKDENAEDLYKVIPGDPIGPYLRKLCRDYLNAVLHFEPNAGADGQWLLLPAPDGTETPLWTFTTEAAPAGKLGHLSASYGPYRSPLLDEGSYRRYVVSPEASAITVTGFGKGNPPQLLQRTLVNFSSFDAPGHSVSDLQSPDWLGCIREVAYNDPTLSTQEAVDFVCRREFAAACKGRVIHQFVAEHVLLNVVDVASPAYDPLTYTDKKRRALRVLDTVNLVPPGSVTPIRCIVSSVSPAWVKDGYMLSFYELEEWRYDLVFGG